MLTHNEVFIRGPIDRVFELAAAVEDWPRILPHYREVAVLEPGEPTRKVYMHCVRMFGTFAWPCRWQAMQERYPAERRIVYRHVKGPTKGMWVEWKLTQEEGGVRTRIVHQLRYPVPVLGPIIANAVIGPVFIHHIAGLTLATIKEIVEREAGA